MIRNIFMHFAGVFDSSQDDVVVFGKWLTAWVILSLPAYVPDMQDWIKFVSVVFGCLTAIAGFIVMILRLIDNIKKRYKK